MIRFLADALRFYFEFHARYDGFYGAFVHDPLVVAAALDPELVRTEAVSSRSTRPAARATGRRSPTGGASAAGTPNADVAVDGRRRRVPAPAGRAGRGPCRVASAPGLGRSRLHSADGSPTDGGLRRPRGSRLRSWETAER